MVPLLYGAPCSSIENRKYKCQIVNTNRIPTFDKMLLSEILLSALFFRSVFWSEGLKLAAYECRVVDSRWRWKLSRASYIHFILKSGHNRWAIKHCFVTKTLIVIYWAVGRHSDSYPKYLRPTYLVTWLDCQNLQTCSERSQIKPWNHYLVFPYTHVHSWS